MDKQLFDEAIGEVPPSTVDVDAAIARGRRAAWTRVANPVLAVAAGVVLVAGGAVVLTLPGDDPSGGVGVARQPAVDTTTPRAGGFCAPPGDAAVASRLTTALATALTSRNLLTGTTLTVDPSVAELEGPGTEPLEFLDRNTVVESDCGVYSAVGVTDGTGRMVVSVSTLDGPVRPETECVAGMEACQAGTGPNGEGIVGFTSGGGHRVDIVKGQVVVVLTAEVLDGGTAAPLTREQLTEVGLDAGLTLNP